MCCPANARSHLLLTLRVTLAGLAWIAVVPPSEAGVTAQQVISAWRDREARSTRFRFDCKKSETIVKGSLQEQASLTGQLPKGSLVPPKDVVLQSRFSMVVDCEKVCFSTSGNVWSTEQNASMVNSYSEAYNGATTTTLFPDGPPFPSGGVSDEARPRDLIALSDCIAPWLVYRPLLFLGEIQKDDIESAAFRECRGSAVPKGSLTIAFRRLSKSDWISYIAVDPARQYLPTRYILENAGQLQFVMSIDYAQDEKLQWVPSSWRWTQRDADGKLANSSEAVVTRCAIGEAIPREAFEIAFPKRARVYEHLNGREAVYIVLDDLSRRYLSREEQTVAGYETVMRPVVRSKARDIVVICAAIALPILVLVLVLRIRRRQRAV